MKATLPAPAEPDTRPAPSTPSAMLPTALVIGGSACLSASAMFVKLAEVNAGTAAFLRCALALVALVPIAVFEVRRRGPLAPAARWWSVAAGAFLGLDYAMWMVSILTVGAAVATVLVNVQVIVFPVLARVFSGTRMTRRFLLTSPVMLGGVVLASGALGHNPQVRNPIGGALLGIAAGIAYAAYLYCNRLASAVNPDHVGTPIALSTATAALVAGVISLFTTGIELDLPLRSWAWLAALALLGQVLAWMLISAGSRSLAPNVSAALLLSQPVLAVGFGVLILGETPTAWQLLGCAVVVAMVWFVNRNSAAAKRESTMD